MLQKTIEKSDEWKKGNKWKQLETDVLDDIDKGSVARNHAHLMRPAGPNEEDDIRVGALLYGDEGETVRLFRKAKIHVWRIKEARPLSGSTSCAS